MTMIQLLACAGMIAGCFFLLRLRPVEFTDDLFSFLLRKPKTLKEEINEATRRKKPGILKKEITEAQDILVMTGRGNRFSLVCAVSLALFAAGGSFAIMIGNFFLAPVMACGFLFIPFWYVRLTANHYKKNVSAELETGKGHRQSGGAFSVTGSYTREPNDLPTQFLYFHKRYRIICK